jgi:hypothetical protein
MDWKAQGACTWKCPQNYNPSGKNSLDSPGVRGQLLQEAGEAGLGCSCYQFWGSMGQQQTRHMLCSVCPQYTPLKLRWCPHCAGRKETLTKAAKLKVADPESNPDYSPKPLFFLLNHVASGLNLISILIFLSLHLLNHTSCLLWQENHGGLGLSVIST